MRHLKTRYLKPLLGAGLLGATLLAGGAASAAENLRMSTLGPGPSPS
jgi:outer membrane murein-binding lipoprotein Lpp